MLPKDVLQRRDISSGCKIVIAGLAMESHGSGRIAISHQALAFVCGMSRPSVLECLSRLCAVGLIKKDGSPVKQVQPYLILHHRLVTKPTAGREATPDVKRAVISCPKCHKKRPMLLKIGWCRSCEWERKVGRIAEGVYQKKRSEAAVA